MSSRPVISRELFESLEDEALLRAVFDPSLMQIRGRDYAFKRSVLNSLTAGQRSLFMFISLFYHNTLGWEKFMNAFSLYFPEGYLWDIKEGLAYLNERELSDIIERCERLFYSSQDETEKAREYGILGELYDELKEKSLRRVVDFIRTHCDEFVVFRRESRQ